MVPKIAIIDSGVSGEQISNCFKVDVVGDIHDSIDHINHGSVIFNIIKNYSKNVRVRCVKITDDIEIREEALCAALRLLLRDSDVDIVNISMGVVIGEKIGEIAELCSQLRKRGIIIVSAFDNDGAMSYPAALPGILGVDVSPRCKLINQYEYVESEIINIRAFSGVLNTKVDNKVLSVAGTSFACAIMTAKVADLYGKGVVDFEEILEKLKKDASYVVQGNYYEAPSEMWKISRAIVFPFNKEMNALLANQDLLNFDIMGVYDPSQLGNVGKRVSDILSGSLKKDFIINSISNMDWKLDFDTVILGHTREISETLNYNFKEYIVQQCIKYNKALYSFDNIDAKDGLKYYEPRILDVNVPSNRFGKLYQVHCPVLGVFGTSSRQGKFTLQLKLRSCFLNAGYHVAQIGTEPSAPLFGMDAVYPMGYDGITPKNARDAITVINDMLNKCVTSETDIVLVGAQSGSNVYSCQNISLFHLETHNFLLAVQPDAIVLCVNSYDDDEYIYRTIMTLENTINTYVIALVISPISFVNIDSGLSRKTSMVEKIVLENFRIHLLETFHKEVFILDFEDDGSEVFEYCTKILSEGYKNSDLVCNCAVVDY